MIKKMLLLFLMANSGNAQSISKQVIGSAGMSVPQLSWTTGEAVVGLMQSSVSQLGNGYYDAKSLVALGIEDYSLDVQLKVYPNPTAQMLYVSHPEQTAFSIGIADLNGRQFYSGTINTSTPLDVGQYPQGIYLVTIASTETHKKNTYKIIKK
jgi:hypothetical protein